ncbi:MAG: ribonuclease HI [Methanophagales archaeon]|nr:ribonuclease HI [Methanophagales archaeon]
MGESDIENIEVHFDGACEPVNPGGIATFGFVIYKNGETVKAEKGLACEPFSSYASNNVAEYTAMLKALEFVIKNGLCGEHAHITVKGDSQLTIRQMNGIYAVRAPRIIPLFKKANELTKNIKHIRFVWIPREQNTVADDLSHQAYTEYVDIHPEIRDKIKSYGATEKQKALMDRLKIKYDKYISKREASRLIRRKLNVRKEENR